MAESVSETTATTAGEDYTDRLVTLEATGLKRFLPTQAPYRWNLRRLRLGRTLDVGCGIGRNLHGLSADSVGVDHNPTSVATARARGLHAFTDGEFFEPDRFAPGSFDSLLCAHVLEHMPAGQGEDVLRGYLPYVRPGGRVVLICPQEAGYATDATHVRYLDFAGLREVAGALGLEPERDYSFPLPRAAGARFPYNEFVLLTRTPAA